jgi:PAS domain S-box-containing protein
MEADFLKIFIVEDETAHTEAIQRAFKSAGSIAQFRVASSLYEYRQIIKEWRPDIAIVDLNLSDGRASEVLIAPPENGPFPIVIMTSFGNEHIAVETIKAGALDYIVKSSETFAAMPRTLERVLREWKLLQEHKVTDAALRESEEKYRHLVENLGKDYFFYRHDTNGVITYVSPSSFDMLGYSQQETLTHFAEFLSDNPLNKEVIKHTALSVQGLQQAPYEVEIVHKDGSLRWLEITEYPVRAQDGSVIAIEGIAKDITERKRADERIHNLNRVYRVLSNISQAIIRTREPIAMFHEACRIAIEDGGFRMAWMGLVDETTRKVEPVAHAGVADGYMEMLNITLSDEPHGRGPTATAVRTGVHDICNDIEHDPRMAPWLEDTLRLGYRASIALPLIVNGKTRGTFNLYAGTPGFFVEEEVKLLDELAMDISFAMEVAEREEQRQRADGALRNSEKFIKDILSSVGEAIVVVDRDHRILSANRAYCEQVGKTLESIIGRPCYEILHYAIQPCHEPEHVCGCKRTFETGEPAVAVHTHTDEKGKQSQIEIKTYAMKDESGKVQSVIEIINDITEKTALERQLQHAQKMEGIGTLAGGIAHDFNNILSAIIGYGHLTLMKMPQDDPLRLNIEHMLESADRAASLTQSLLSFSRKQIMDRKPVDLNKIIRKVEKFLVRVIGEDVEIRMILDEKLLTIFADAGQLEQVFMNLATNARDAMPHGGSFTIETAITEMDYGYIAAHGYGKPGSYAMITATDTGVGMNEETRKKIFEPFFTTKEVGKGTGLGLAMAYGIIKQHEGFINVYSEPGKGTTFRIYLPLIKSASVEGQKAIDVEYPKGGSETILLAEDDSNLRKLAVSILEQMGYTVITANDGEEAVTKFIENKGRIQLLLFDIMMPKKNGREAYDEIRKVMPNVPVLFASGYSPDMLREKALIEKGEAMIYKPMSPQDLLKKVREVLDRYN